MTSIPDDTAPLLICASTYALIACCVDNALASSLDISSSSKILLAVTPVEKPSVLSNVAAPVTFAVPSTVSKCVGDAVPTPILPVA